MIDDVLTEIERSYAELTAQLAEPEVLADRTRYAAAVRRHGELEPLYAAVREYREAQAAVVEAQELLGDDGGEGLDDEMRAFLTEELEAGRARLVALEEQIRLGMLEHDPDDEKSAILEIRGGTGGDEAAFFAADLFRMYARHAESRGFQVEVLSANEPPTGGFKEVIAELRGAGAYGTFKYESGVHRVQRVPANETASRIHTSTATVAVLPEVEDIEIEIDPNELRVDIFRARGPGGQSVNTTDSAVRITHVPTGLVVSCQDEKSQYQNKDKAMRILRARLYELRKEEQQRELAEARRDMVQTGSRAQKIRTYNYQQNRVTDHRIGFTTHRLTEILNGDLDELTEALEAADREAQVAHLAGAG
jgi:peptide chain release factor 1